MLKKNINLIIAAKDCHKQAGFLPPSAAENKESNSGWFSVFPLPCVWRRSATFLPGFPACGQGRAAAEEVSCGFKAVQGWEALDAATEI